MKRVILLILTVVVCVNLAAQTDTVYLKRKPSIYIKQSIAPAALIGAGMFMKLNNTGFNDLSVKQRVNDALPGFNTYADDYLRFAAIPFIYGLDLVGVKAETDIKNRTAIFFKAEAIMWVSVTLLKNSTHVMRPDGSDDHSFPSGHAAQAFLGAVMIQREYGSRSIWYPVAGYTVAASVAALRIANNRHYTSDVLVGAGIGMLSANLAYWTHRYKWNKNITVMPAYSNRSAGVYFSMTF